MYEANKGRYGDLKKALASDLEEFIAPMRAVRDNLTDDDVKKVLAEGVIRAKEYSSETLKRVREVIGIAI